jgi:hypothetical protein
MSDGCCCCACVTETDAAIIEYFGEINNEILYIICFPNTYMCI